MGWQSEDKGRTLASMFFKRGRELEYVRPGSMFKRVHDDEIVETAKVESVATNADGIPHVKFKVSFSRPNRVTYDEGSCMLALRSFADLYKERVLS